MAKPQKRIILVEYAITCEDKFCGECSHSLCEGPTDDPWLYGNVCCLFDRKIRYDKKTGSCVRHKKCIEGEITKREKWTHK